MILLLFLMTSADVERPLAYYLTDPCVRKGGAQCQKSKASVSFVGKIREGENDQTEVYDVEYNYVGSGTTHARSVLAGPSKTQLREIHTRVNDGGSFLPTEFSPRDSRLFWVRARWKSSSGSIVDTYVQQRDSQWLVMDFEPVFEAARKILPEGDAVVTASAELDLETRVYRVDTQGGGDIEVRFQIAERMIPGVAKFHRGGDSPRLWTRRVSSAKGDYANAVLSHPIRYFYPHPCLRKDPVGESVAGALSCLPSGRAGLLTVKSKLREVGQIGEFRVYEIRYRGMVEDSEAKIQSVLVGRSLDSLYEIWLRDSTYSTGDAIPVKIVLAGGTQPLIETNFSDGGMYHINYQQFFWLSRRGPRPVDFSAPVKAAQRAIPKTEGLFQPATGYGVPVLRWGSGTYELKDGLRKTSCCVGIVEVPYTIEDGIAKPVEGKARYRRTLPPH